MHTVYYPFQFKINETIELNEEESWHLNKVARIKLNELVNVINGKGLQAIGSVINSHPKQSFVKIQEVYLHDLTPVQLHIAVAPTKNADRYEWMIEKAVELGLYQLTPLITERTERKKINLERLKKIALAACKQSKSPWLLQINEPISFNNFVTLTSTVNLQSMQFLIAHCSSKETRGYSLKQYSVQKLNTILLIGPEGDFTSTEIEYAINQNYQAVKLTNQTLRTETAAIYACSLWAE
jgi:16S rRNA (uracil1498-N3)-methyltransferase